MLLKNEFSFLKKSKIKAGEGKKDGAYPFFTSSDSKLLYLDEYIFDDEAIIVGTGGMPSCNYYNGKFAVSTDNYVLVPIGKTKAKTLYYFLRNNNLEILARGFHGAGLKHIGKDYLENIQLPVITAAIQDKLIKELDSIVLFIKSLDNQLEKLDELIKSRFIEMFGNPVMNSYNWETKLLKQITTKIGSGATPRGGKSSYPSEGVFLIRSMNVYDNEFEYENLAHLTDKQAKELDNVIVKSGDVLFNITGASIARCCVVPDDVLPARVNQHVSIVRTAVINNLFLSHLLTCYPIKNKLIGIGESSGATRQALTKSDLENVTIIVPPIELQNEFSGLVKLVDKSKFILQKQKKNLEELYESKLHEYFGD